jgi:hypothetical protein
MEQTHPDTTDTDLAAIYQAAADYYDGWYSANVEQIDRSLHSGLAKRAIRKDKAGKEYLHHMDKAQMLRKTEEGGGSQEVPAGKRHYQITILDRYEEIASVKVAGPQYVDYLHLARQDGQWLIVNALWTNNHSV